MNLFRATKFEFKYRFWLTFILFFAGFGLVFFYRQSAGVYLAGIISPRSSPGYRLTVQLIFGAGALIVLAGGLLRAWGTAYLGAAVVRDFRVHTEALTADGPFRFVRNPLYLGMVLMGVGLGLVAPLPGWILIVVGMSFFTLRLLGREEWQLAADLGESYEDYRRAVPRLVPSLWPRVPASGVSPKWGQAILAELMYWICAAAMLALAVTLNGRVFEEILFPGLIAGVILFGTRARFKRRK